MMHNYQVRGWQILVFCFAVNTALFSQSAPLSSLEQGWSRIKIEGHGTIDLPPNMEIQGGRFRELNNSWKEVVGVSASQVIFQQKNLNSFEKKSFDTYARVFIRNELGSPGDFNSLFRETNYSLSELKDLEVDSKREVVQLIASMGGKLLEWNSPKNFFVNGMKCVTWGYKRQLPDNLPTQVNLFLFENYDRMHLLNMEYRIDGNNWKSTFEKILKSYRINPR